LTEIKASQNKDNNMRFIYAILLCILIVASTASVVSYNKKAVGQTPPVLVEAIPARLEAWQKKTQAVGSLSASQGTVIKAETTGRITAIYFRSGENVKVGTPLLQLNPDILKAQLDGAKAATKLSKADYERGLTLFKKKVFAQADFDKVSASYQINLAKQAQTQALLNQTLIRAPFSGRLGLRQINLGDMIDPTKPIVDLEAINPLWVDFNLPGTEANKIAIGSKVLIHASAYPDKTFVGSIYALDSHIDNDTRSIAVRASLKNAEQKLLPGAFVDIQIEIGKPQTLFIVPETAVNTDEKGSFIYRVINHKAVKTCVNICFHKDGKMGLLSSDIHAGDQIISVGGFKVQANSVVLVEK
jgi:membrane fusion protein (multidrug efflux system)